MLCRSSCHLSEFLLNRLLDALLSFPHQVGKELQPWKKCTGSEGEEALNICLEVWPSWQRVGGCYVWTLACSGLQLLMLWGIHYLSLNVCSFEAFVAMSVTFQERHEFQSGKEALASWLEQGAVRRHRGVLECHIMSRHVRSGSTGFFCF